MRIEGIPRQEEHEKAPILKKVEELVAGCTTDDFKGNEKNKLDERLEALKIPELFELKQEIDSYLNTPSSGFVSEQQNFLLSVVYGATCMQIESKLG